MTKPANSYRRNISSLHHHHMLWQGFVLVKSFLVVALTFHCDTAQQQCDKPQQLIVSVPARSQVPYCN